MAVAETQRYRREAAEAQQLAEGEELRRALEAREADRREARDPGPFAAARRRDGERQQRQREAEEEEVLPEIEEMAMEGDEASQEVGKGEK
jgi:hypothetical protein